MRRTPEVIDAWFDSGSMPFAQWHYPFENREKFERQYPADFIAEGVDQTRGWFYSLLAIATGLGDALPNNLSRTSRTPRRRRHRAVSRGRRERPGARRGRPEDVEEPGNVVDPWTVIARHGADAVRLFLVPSSQLWMPRRFDEAGIRESAGRFLLTLKNVYSGIFAQYANFGWSPSDSDPAPDDRPLIDRWMLSRLATRRARGRRAARALRRDGRRRP